MAADVVVLDYGSGNLRSAQRALARAGADVRVTADLGAARECDGLVVPGVGAYAACMTGLRGVGGDKVIAERIARRRPVLGICVGMQVLFSAGVEHGIRTEGCEVWPGTVDRLDAPVLPHMGWNTVQAPAGSALFAGLDPATRFYFVHSYALRLRDAAPLQHLDLAAGRGPGGRGAESSGPGSSGPGSSGAGSSGAGNDPAGDPGTSAAGRPAGAGHGRARVTLATHGEPFVAAVEDGLVSATQFHPEKSGDAGAAVLRNWLGTL